MSSRRLCTAFLPIMISAIAVPASVCVAGVDTVWSRQMGFGSTYSNARDIALDAYGNIYVGGTSRCCDEWSGFGVAKFNENGDTLWVRSLEPDGNPIGDERMVVDDSGYVYMAGGEHHTIKFARNGDTLWLRQLDGLGGLTAGLAIDPAGNVYVVDDELRVVKYTADGDSLWFRSSGYPIDHYNWPAFDISVDNSGNAVALGGTIANGSFDYLTVKYGPAGDTLWTRPFNGSANSADYSAALAIDDAGNVIVTGSSYSSESASFDYATVKYDPDGQLLWVATYDTPTGAMDIPVDVAVDDGGYIYVTGYSIDVVASAYSTIKYSPNGDSIWSAQFTGKPGFDMRADAMALDDSGSVYIIGVSDSTSVPRFAYTVKYSTNGVERWVMDYPLTIGCCWTDIAVNSSFDVHVVGGGFALAKYSQADQDADGAIDLYDNCLTTPNPGQANNDADSLGDSCDNCRTVTNDDQAITIEATGDVNLDGVVTSADIIYLVTFIFKGGFAPSPCEGAGDVNCTGGVTSADIIYLVGYVFKGEAPPCEICEAEGLGWSCP